MLATGKATILEVANRQVAERPETREADASGGRFAGLMAHWIQPQAMAKPPEKTPGGGPEISHRKTSTSKEATGTPSATPKATPVSSEAGPALKPGSPAAPKPTAAPAQSSPSTPAAADAPAATADNPPAAADNPAATTNDPAASASDPVVVPSVTVLPATAAGLPESASLVPTPAQALATLAAQALSVLQAGLPGGPLPSIPAPSAPAPTPQGAALLKNVPATLDPVQAPVPPQATTTAQAVLAEDAPKTKEKGPSRELQAALEALQATPPTADPVAVKAGVNPAATLDPHEAPAVAPAKAGPLVLAAGLNVEPSQADPGAPKALPVTRGTDGAPSEATSGPAPAPTPQHIDSSAMAALTAQPRSSAPAAGATPAAPLPNTPAQPSPLVTQVAGGVRWMLQGGSQEAQLQLHPDSLGQVTIHLRVEGGEVHARLWVTEASAVQAVQEGRPHLEASLKEQGLQLGSFDLQQGQRPFQEASTTHAYPDRPVLKVAPAGQEAPSLPATAILNAHHVELYA